MCSPLIASLMCKFLRGDSQSAVRRTPHLSNLEQVCMHITQEKPTTEGYASCAVPRSESDAFLWKVDEAGRVVSVLDALATHIAVLDEAGTIIAVNRAWREFGRANGATAQQVSEGVNY